MSDFEKAMLDPTSIYNEPKEVLEDDSMSREQKIKILRQWEYDAKELQTADDENMAGGDRTMLARVLAALHELGEVGS